MERKPSKKQIEQERERVREERRLRFLTVGGDEDSPRIQAHMDQLSQDSPYTSVRIPTRFGGYTPHGEVSAKGLKRKEKAFVTREAKGKEKQRRTDISMGQNDVQIEHFRDEPLPQFDFQYPEAGSQNSIMEGDEIVYENEEDNEAIRVQRIKNQLNRQDVVLLNFMLENTVCLYFLVIFFSNLFLD
jgi:hypothetical protein